MKTDKQRMKEENAALRENLELLMGVGQSQIKSALEMEEEIKGLKEEQERLIHIATDHLWSSYRDGLRLGSELGRKLGEISTLQADVVALEESRAFWKREWHLMAAAQNAAERHIVDLEAEKKSAGEYIMKLQAERRRDAIDGQGALEDRDNEILYLTNCYKPIK